MAKQTKEENLERKSESQEFRTNKSVAGIIVDEIISILQKGKLLREYRPKVSLLITKAPSRRALFKFISWKYGSMPDFETYDLTFAAEHASEPDYEPSETKELDEVGYLTQIGYRDLTAHEAEVLTYYEIEEQRRSAKKSNDNKTDRRRKK